MCPAGLPTLLVLLLVAASGTQCGYAQQAIVENPAQLRAALSDAAVDNIVLPQQVSLDSSVFSPVTVARTIVMASDGAYGCLGFGNTSSVLLSVGPGGNMTLQGLTVRSFYPAQPLQVTPASSIMPIASVGISRDSAELHLQSCVFHVQGQLKTVTGPMPFWSTVLQEASTAVGSTQQQVVPVSAQMSYFGGNSSVTVRKSVLAMDPSGCYTGQGHLTWDSRSLWNAVQKPALTHAVVFVNISLSAQHFSPLVNSPVGNMTISGCSSTALNFNQLHNALAMQQGATLQFMGPLQLLGAATAHLTSRNSNNSSGLLLLGSVDISSGARLLLQDVEVGVSNSSSVLQDMRLFTQGTTAPAVVWQLPAATGQRGFVVQSWDADLSGVMLPQAVVAAQGTRLILQNVTVLQTVQSCFPVGSIPAVASEDGKLRAFLLDPDITAIQIMRDMKLDGEDWQAKSSEDIVDISRPVEIRGCHPNAASGGRYTLDFSELEGATLFNLRSMLRISGDLVLKGLPDREGSPGSWMLMPFVNLASDEAVLVVEDVLLTSKTASPLHAGGTAWQSAGGIAAAARTWSSMNSSMSVMQQVKVSMTTAVKLFPACFSNTSRNDSARRHLLQAVLPTSSRSSSSDSSYYGYISTQLLWDPSLIAKPQHSVDVAPLVLGLILGLVLIAAVAAVLLRVRRRGRRMLQYQQHGTSKHWAGPESGYPLGACCWKQPWKKDIHLQRLVANGTVGQNGSVYTATDNHTASWAAADGPGQIHEIPVLSSITNLDTSGVVGPVGSLENSRHGPMVFPPRPLLAAQNHYSGAFAVGSSLQLSAQPSPHYRELVDATHIGQYESKLSGGLDIVDGLNSVHPATITGGGYTTDGNTTIASEGTGGVGGVGGTGGQHKQHKQQVFEDARRRLGAAGGDLARSDALVLESVLGEGTFGKVFKGYWKGTLVAVKTMMFPAAMSGKEKREKMAIMETAISASLSHPNIVQMYTYYLRPVLVGHEATLTGPQNTEADRLDRSSVGDSTMNAAFLNEGLSDSVHSWEVQLVLEYCDQGSLRSLLNKKGAFIQPDGSKDMVLVVDTALDVARAMLHLHSENILHSDLKARNILLKSSGGADGRPFVAKVADFGLSMRIDPNATHVSNVYQGTMTHMAPEVMLKGKLSRGSDVYAFGVLLWELYSGGHAFRGVPRALLGHEVAHKQRRPEFPEGSPFEYQLLACRCWESDVSIRPSFHEILLELQRMKERLAAAAASTSATQPSSDRTSNATPASHSRAIPQQQRLSSKSRPLTPVSHSGSQEAGDAVQGSKAANGGAAGAACAGNLQELAIQQQQHQHRLQQPPAVAHGGSDERGAPIGRTDMQQADACTAADNLQQQRQQWEGGQQLGLAQQRRPQRRELDINSEVTTDNLLRQSSASIATGDSIECPRPLASAAGGGGGAADGGALGEAVGLPTADSLGSPPIDQHNDSSMHRQARGSAADQSVYLSDPFESTTDEFHPRFVLYGAGAHLRQRGIFWPDSVTSSDASQGSAEDQSPPATPAAADSAAAATAVSGQQAYGPQHAAASSVAVGAAGTAATAPDSQRLQHLVASDGSGMQQQHLQQQQQRQCEIQQEHVNDWQQQDSGPQHLGQSQQNQQRAALPGIKRLTSAAAAAAKKMWQSNSANRHTAAHAATAPAPAPSHLEGLEAPQPSPTAAAGGVDVWHQQGINATVSVTSDAAAVMAAPSEMMQQQQQRSPSLDADSSRRTSSSSRRSAEISTSTSNRSVDLADRSSTDSQQQQQQTVQLVPVFREHLQQIDEGSSGEPSSQRKPSVLAQLQQQMKQQQQRQVQQGQTQQEQPHVAAQLQQGLDQQPLQQQQQVPAQEQFPHVLSQIQDPNGAGPSEHQQQPLHQQQQQQQPPGPQQHITWEQSRRSTDGNSSSSSGSVSHSSSGLAPTSDSSPSRSRIAHSGSAAAVAAVMSLKAALAKRAMADRTATTTPAAPAAAAGTGTPRVASSLPIAVRAVPPAQDNRSGLSAVGRTADDARLLQQQQHQQLSMLRSPATAVASAGGSAVLPYSSFSARRSLQVGPTSSGTTTPFALSPPVAQTSNTTTAATSTAAGRYSLDARAKSVSVAAISREHHKLAPRAVASARGAFPGAANSFGNNLAMTGTNPSAAAPAIGDSAVSSASASPVPPKTKFSFNRAVRKALSARDLSARTRAAAAASMPEATAADAKMPVSSPTAATSCAGDVSLAQQLQQQQQQQQPRDPQQLQLQQVQWLEQAASAGSSNSQDPALAALAPDQLQQLAQIADAAKAQVSFELPLPQPTRSTVCGPSGSFSAPGVPTPPQPYPMSHTLFAVTGQPPSLFAGPATAGPSAAATGMSGQFAVTVGQSISDPTSHQVPAHLLPPPRHWGGYLGPSAAGPSSRAADMAAGPNSQEPGACTGPQAAGWSSPSAPAAGRFSLDTRKSQFGGGAGGGPASVNPSGNVLRYAAQQRPVGEQTEHSSIYHSQASPGQEAAYLAAPGAGFDSSNLGQLGHAQSRTIPTGRAGTKPRRASAPLQHLTTNQRERRYSALQSIVDHEVVDQGVGRGPHAQSKGSVWGMGRSRRASAPAPEL